MHIRLPGTWLLNPQAVDLKKKDFYPVFRELMLTFGEVTRTEANCVLQVNGTRIDMNGRMRIGNPTTISLYENVENDRFGIEIIMYVPPFWPNIDYEYDALIGTMSIGIDSAAATEKVSSTPIFFHAIKEWED